MPTRTGRLLAAASICALSAVPSLAHAAWTRSYVVQWFEPAFYYGGQGTDLEKPGTDCPAGTNPASDWIAALKRAGMSDAEAEKYRDPEYRNHGHSYNDIIYKRGPGMTNVYLAPESVPDPGLVQVTGTVGYGFDLDDNPDTGGFTSPDGKIRGIDNAFYKVSGCVYRWRGPPHMSQSASYSNDGMHDGVFTVVLLVSGAGNDPMNEADATLGVYLSKDKMVKDANGRIATDFTFRVDPQARYQSVLKVRVKDGVIETTAPQKITMRDDQTPNFFPTELTLEQGRVKLSMTPEGLKGLIGGYRDWRVYYQGTSGNGFNGAGAIHENLGKFELPAWYRAMKREADGMADPRTGEKFGISTAYSIEAVPAFVTTPQGDKVVEVAQAFAAAP